MKTDQPTLIGARLAVDPDPCRLDHHGTCQAHGLGDPCEQLLLKAALARLDGAEGGATP